MKKIINGYPFLYLEHGSLYRKDETIIFENKLGKQQIPLDSFIMLMFGPGVSFSSNAVSNMVNNECFIAISSASQNPKVFLTTFCETGNANFTINQVSLFSNRNSRFSIAKSIMKDKFQDDTFENCKSTNELMLKEARITRKLYSSIFGNDFKRSYDKKSDFSNAKINIANNAVYNYCGAIIHLLGLCPHIGFIHGKIRNAFIFDLSELIKTEEYYKLVNLSPDFKTMLNETNLFIKSTKQKKVMEFLQNVFNKDNIAETRETENQMDKTT
jgi:CRISPR/Cas system-associated endonuclease Cas1